MHMEAVIERVWRCTWRPWSCERGGRNRTSWTIQLEPVIERIWRCTWRPWRSECGGCDRVSSEINMEAVIVRVWPPWLCELGGRDRTPLVIRLEAVIEWLWRCTWRPWCSEIGGVLGGGSSGERRDRRWDSTHWSTRNCRNVEIWVQHGLTQDERLAGSGRQSILRWCSTRCMQKSVYAVLGVCCTRCYLLFMAWRDRERSLNIVFFGDGRVEVETERHERVHHEKLGLSRIPCARQCAMA